MPLWFGHSPNALLPFGFLPDRCCPSSLIFLSASIFRLCVSFCSPSESTFLAMSNTFAWLTVDPGTSKNPVSQNIRNVSWISWLSQNESCLRNIRTVRDFLSESLLLFAWDCKMHTQCVSHTDIRPSDEDIRGHSTGHDSPRICYQKDDLNDMNQDLMRHFKGVAYGIGERWLWVAMSTTHWVVNSANGEQQCCSVNIKRSFQAFALRCTQASVYRIPGRPWPLKAPSSSPGNGIVCFIRSVLLESSSPTIRP